MKFCAFCKQVGRERVKAIWRDKELNFACERHKGQLRQGRSDVSTSEGERQAMRMFGI